MGFSVFTFFPPMHSSQQGEFLQEDKVTKKIHKGTQYAHSGVRLHLAAERLKHFKLGKLVSIINHKLGDLHQFTTWKC